jgi:hypothetical protein
MDEDPPDLDGVGKHELARALVVGVAGSVPVIGSIVASLVDLYLPEQRARRTEEFLAELAQAVGSVGNRVDRDFVRVDEFHGLVEEVLERVASRRAEGLRGYYAAALANAATKTRPDEQTRFRMLDALSRLRPHHLHVLAGLAAASSPTGAGPDVITVGQAAVANVTSAVGDASNDLWKDLLDLEQLGLTRSLDKSLLTVAGGARSLLTPFGLRFLEFLRINEELA